MGRSSASSTATAATPAATRPNNRCAIANTQSVNPAAAASSIEYHTPYCITGHTTTTNKIPPAITSERCPGSRRASTVTASPKMIARVMWIASPMTSAGALKVSLSGADR
jgi:hypothetical protein